MANSKIKNKKIIELESLLKFNKFYVFRSDGVDFKEFRVGVLELEELMILYQVFYDLSKLILNKFSWIRVIYFFDDEINLAFKGSESKFGRRVQKNLSILTSFISVEFNRLIMQSAVADKLSRKQEYYFDGRFVEIKDKTSLKEYFAKEQRKSHTQVKNLLSNIGIKGKKPSIDKIIADYLGKDENLKGYFCLFGCFISRNSKDVKMIVDQSTYVKDISLMIDKSFNR